MRALGKSVGGGCGPQKEQQEVNGEDMDRLQVMMHKRDNIEAAKLKREDREVQYKLFESQSWQGSISRQMCLLFLFPKNVISSSLSSLLPSEQHAAPQGNLPDLS